MSVWGVNDASEGSTRLKVRVDISGARGRKWYVRYRWTIAIPFVGLADAGELMRKVGAIRFRLMMARIESLWWGAGLIGGRG